LRLASLLAPGGLLMLVNHSFFAFDAASRRAHAIHDAFRWSTGLERVAEYRRPFYRVTLPGRQASA